MKRVRDEIWNVVYFVWDVWWDAMDKIVLALTEIFFEDNNETTSNNTRAIGDSDMEQIKVFISQPMTGLSVKEIDDRREEITNKCVEVYGDNVLILDTHFTDYEGSYSSDDFGLWCLGKAIKEMSFADVVVFATGYEKSRGCSVEFTCADEYGKKIVLEEWLTDESKRPELLPK